jgi:solute carrier family 35 protein E3
MKAQTDEHPSILGGSGKEPLLKDVESAGANSAKQGGGPSGAIMVTIYILGSIFSSVFVVLCNKAVFTRGFSFPLTVSFIAYMFTWLYYVVLEMSGAWKPSAKLPNIENFKVALSSVGSISFMNLCLLTNTVAIYQICKFAVIPCTLVIQKLFFQIDTNWRVLMSLAVVLGGVGYSTMTGFESGNLSVKGITFACLAVLSTSVYRIWQETKQKEFKVGPVDFQACMAGWQAAIGLVFAVAVEFFAVESGKTVPSYFAAVYNNGFGGQFPSACAWMMGTCIFALLVNFTSFGLIGKTGPIAYAVVGHAKTVLTIFMGMALFPKEDTRKTMIADIIGCAVAMFGVIAYGHFEYCLKKKKADLVEQTFPSLCAKTE